MRGMALFLGVCMGIVNLAHADTAAYYKIRGGIPNSQYFFKHDKVGNQYLFFIGHSVLAGTGLKNQDLRYSRQMRNSFKKHFPHANPIERRYLYPGGSWFGQFRCSHGEAVFGAVICSGHLAILDFAAEDRHHDLEQVKRSLEGLVRQITTYRATHSQILVYTLTPELLDAYVAGKTPAYIEVCEAIADHYNIPSLNLARYAADQIKAGHITFDAFSADGITPTDAGAAHYAAATTAFVEALLAAREIPEKPKPVTLPPPLFADTDARGRIVAYEHPAVTTRGAWHTGRASPITPFRHLLASAAPGAEITFRFTGSEVGIIDVVDQDSTALTYQIDEDAPQTIPAPAVTAPTMRTVPLAQHLKRDREHLLTLKTGPTGTARIGGFLLIGSVANPYAGMSTLERIDAIYAGMAPIPYTPPTERFVYLPKTIDTLRNGGTLRMVLLGDSIMGNTSASAFDLLLQRRYPTCRIIKIASLRSSTGCTYYQHENRVDAYVLRHNPDLLIIGGISNGQDAEPVRSVIRQVRAKKPDTEVLLLTPVFGAMRDAHIRAFTPEVDTTTANFRHGMMRVAAEERCAFFDMTGPWWTYIQQSGKTPGWFMGDAVHANQRGCQIIGRLLEIWFSE